MDFSKLRLGLYDLFGILIPGFIIVADVWITIVGWKPFVAMLAALSGNLVAVLALMSYAMGHLVQEAGDMLVRAITHDRYLKKSRDRLWEGKNGKTVREEIKKREGLDIADVDTAFDYCLTKAKHSFEKRDAFIATSDLARSFVLLAILTGIPAVHALFYRTKSVGFSLILELAALIAAVSLVVFVSWRRMMRYREFADKPVFAAYLATVKDTDVTNKPSS
jgi:hypothetical protein